MRLRTRNMLQVVSVVLLAVAGCCILAMANFAWQARQAADQFADEFLHQAMDDAGQVLAMRLDNLEFHASNREALQSAVAMRDPEGSQLLLIDGQGIPLREMLLPESASRLITAAWITAGWDAYKTTQRRDLLSSQADLDSQGADGGPAIAHLRVFPAADAAVITWATFSSAQTRLQFLHARQMQALRNAIAIAAIALVLGALAAWFLSGHLLRRSIERPVQALLDGMDRFAGGDHASRIEPEGDVEIARAAAGFNAMAERVTATDRELQRHRQEVAAILAGSADAIVSCDPTGCIRLANQAAQALSGAIAAPPVGARFVEVFPLGLRQDHEGAVDPFALLRDGSLHRLELRVPGTAAIPVDVSIARIDEPPGVVLVMRDMRRLIALEQQLRQAQRLEAIGLLAGGVAHDLNNMLTVVQGSIEMLRMQEGPLSSTAARHLQAISQACTSSATLIRQLLAFARRSPLRRRTIDLNGLLVTHRDLLLRVLPSVIRLELHPALQPALISGDADLLVHALINLLVNARDAMPAGGVVTVSVSNEVGWVLLRVGDTGSGMGAEVQQHIFQPFFTTKPVGQGTGLGLAAVHGTVQSHDGSIDVVSAPGAGTTFVLRFPAAREALITG